MTKVEFRGRVLEVRSESRAQRSAGAPRDGDAAERCAGSVEPDFRFESRRDLRYVRGYVVNRHTGEVLSSVIADKRREHRSRHVERG